MDIHHFEKRKKKKNKPVTETLREKVGYEK